MKKYDHRRIEKKWQDYWIKNKTYKATMDRSRPKYYVLDMFPYPSGSGLHVGHVAGYTATDIVARYKRQTGHNVLHPMGWDSFGLPAEQYAMRTGTHPAITTETNISTFRRQLQALGFSYDWDREVKTSDPGYYKWTQWIFTKLYERGLAYEDEMLVNYCPALGTVLANEEVEDGKSKEGGHPVDRRPLRQWMLKITAYAERLLDDLDLIDWPDSLKRLQRNWIGKSYGANVHFQVVGVNDKLTVYTTCPETLFGATYMVVAPEHPLVDKIASIEQSSAIMAYRKEVASKSDLERTDLVKEKSGVFTGGYAVNPVNGKSIPIWISDYVLMSYGTGAIMAVPCHDERDFEFAQKFSLPIPAVIDPGLGGEEREAILKGEKCWYSAEDGVMINSANETLSLNGLSIAEAKTKIISWLEGKGIGEGTINYKLRDWLFSRQRYWGEPFPILHLEDGTIRCLSLDELPLTPPQISEYKPSGDGQSPLARIKEWVNVVDPVTGQKARRETNTMPQWAGSCWYYLRFCDPTNPDAAWDKDIEDFWMPVDMYVGGVEHAVLHLLYARFWHKVLYDCGLVSTPEPFMTLRNQGLITSRSYQNPVTRAYVAPEDTIEKDRDYYHKVTGEKLVSQVEKMSKSKLNGVSPDEIIDEFGADSLRMYEMFMGPLEKEKVWNTDAVQGCFRFLHRVFEAAGSDKVCDEWSEAGERLAHRMVHETRQAVENLSFNTGIAKMMEFMNDFTKLERYPREALLWLAQMLYPYAPHAAYELWEILGGSGELAYAPLPEVKKELLEDAMITYVVQVNGKVRGRFELPKDQDQDIIVALAKKNSIVAKYLDGKEVQKVIFVPNKLLNLVV
jgi:leucyl-tRNA synthetase